MFAKFNVSVTLITCLLQDSMLLFLLSYYITSYYSYYSYNLIIYNLIIKVIKLSA